MIHTIAFAKWFLNKHRASGILVDGSDFEFIISQLDQSSWDEFNTTSDYIAISKTTADTLIPQLVEKMPKKPRVKNLMNDTKPKGKKTKVDAQTSTDTNVNDKPVLENGKEVAEQPLDVPVKEVKKRATKAVKKIEKDVVVPTNTEEVHEVAEQPLDVPVKEVKKRAPKASKKIEENVAENVDQQYPIVPLKEVKKRGPKSDKKIEKDVVVPTNTEEVHVVAEQPLAVSVKNEMKEMEKEVKKRGPKAAKKEDAVENDGFKNKSIIVPDDVVIPINEQTILGADLQEDTYLDYVELNETFINEVLFYKDVNGSWFDALLNPILDPTI